MEEIVIIIVCLGLNALFACFEMAFVTVGRAELRQLARSGNRAASHLLKLRHNPERTLSVIQVGITLVGIISAAAGGAGAEEAFAPYFERRHGLSENASEALAIVLVVVPLTVLNVIFGELIPKAIALRHAVAVSTMGVRWIVIVDRLFAPLVWILERVTKAVLALLPKSRRTENVSQVASVDIDHLSRQTQQYVLNLVGIEQRRVHDVMIGWDRVVAVDFDASREEVTALVVQSGHTRMPVVKDGRVIGLLHTKEYLTTLAGGIEDWHSIVRPVITVPPSALALGTLRKLQEKKTHMAIIAKDERPLGIVTVEDVFEEIVGELYDEDDDGRVQKLLVTQSRRRWWKR